MWNGVKIPNVLKVKPKKAAGWRQVVLETGKGMWLVGHDQTTLKEEEAMEDSSGKRNNLHIILSNHSFNVLTYCEPLDN